MEYVGVDVAIAVHWIQFSSLCSIISFSVLTIVL